MTLGFGFCEQLFTKRKTVSFSKVDWSLIKLLLFFIWQAF